MSTIYDWSLTPGDNAMADTDINWAEGMFPSAVNNSAREMMTRVAEYIKDNGVLDALGTNTIAITSNSPITAITTGMTLAFRAAATNTTAVTLNLNGLGGKDIRKIVAGSTDAIPLVAGDINIKGIYIVHYDATANAGAGAWILTNPLTTTESLGAVPLTGSLLMSGTFQTSGKYVSNSIFATSSQFALLAANGAGAGRGVYLRPNGDTSDVNQLFLNAAGVASVPSLSATGDVTAGQNFRTNSGFAVLAANGSGVLLRPNGIASEVGQANLDSAGNMSAATFNATGAVAAGAAQLQTNGDIGGTVWSPWGSTSAFTAIGARIETRGAAYAASAVSQIMPTIAAQSQFAIGMTVMARYTGAAGPGNYNAGTIVPGTDLGVSNALGTTPFGTIGVGNWRCQGMFSVPSTGDAGVTLFLRVS